MSTTITVSIGRDVPGEGPLGPIAWATFQARLTTIVAQVTGRANIVFTGTGTGQWEGQTEDSFTLVALAEADLTYELAARLALLATVWGQDAIALTIGTTELVRP